MKYVTVTSSEESDKWIVKVKEENDAFPLIRRECETSNDAIRVADALHELLRRLKEELK